MSYMHIENLYKAQEILLFRECYALEKIHGTSAHVMWAKGGVQFYVGGTPRENFVRLFDEKKLKLAFKGMGHAAVTVYGEAYGGKIQAQKWRYGEQLRFVVFEVKIGDSWLAVPAAHRVAMQLELDFVDYVKIPTDLASLDAARDAPSEQAKRNGVEGHKPKEGVVLRPLLELTTNNGGRIIAKHKRDEERETNTPRKVVDPGQLQVLIHAEEIAEEWVTPTRLEHVLDKLGPDIGIEKMKDILDAMIEDVLRESRGEIEDSRQARTSICKRTAKLFRSHLGKLLQPPTNSQ